ncbi:tetratricopeptide repeat protein [Actinoplanes sp. NPDC051861]|uniref:tetratricopeptide repeat protein n=1 Tax=Actinoplanes sp. NPDC051861 TaxID=3155170 RepID=UPI0034368E9C
MEVRRYGLWVGVPTLVAGLAAWAALADDKQGWTVVAAAVAGAVGAFGPTATERLAQAWERRQAQAGRLSRVRVAELPESVTWLLRPDRQVVPFFGRGWLLISLESWFNDPRARPVRMLVGAGGIGKTRLAQELVSRLPQDVRCEWISLQSEAETAALIVPRSLLILDYAEARDRAALAELLCAAQQADHVRVLLLARAAGSWWESLSDAYPRQAHLVDALTSAPDAVVEVPAKVDDVHDARAVVAEAAAAFAARLGRPVPVVEAAREWPPETPVLRLHADALVAVLDGAHRQGDYDVLGEVLGHERRYWSHTARTAGLTGGETLRQVVGIATLTGADTTAEIAQIVRRAPSLRDAPASRLDEFARWLSGLYPAAPGSALGVVQPDLLAEALAVRVLVSLSAEDQTRVLTGLSAGQAVRVLTLLGRARVHEPGADALIETAMRADLPRMVETVVEVGLQFPGVFTPVAVRLFGSADIDDEWARKMYGRVPYPSAEFGALGLALTTRIIDGLPGDAPPGVRALWSSVHTYRLVEESRASEALPVSEDLVRQYRELAEHDREAHLVYLAAALRRHAVLLAGQPRWAEALTFSQEAVGLWEEVVEGGRDGYLSELAGTMNAHAAVLAGNGLRDEALAASRRAIGLHRELVEIDRTAHLPELAVALWSAGHVAMMTGLVTEEVVAAAEEGVRYFGELAAAAPDTYAGRYRNAARTLDEARRRLSDGGPQNEDQNRGVRPA